MRYRYAWRALLLTIATTLPSHLFGVAHAEVPVETLGEVRRLPQAGPHWLWVADPMLRRSALLDLDSGAFLGLVDGGFGITMPLEARRRGEIYVPETHYSRGSRGVRTDVLTIYDATSLAPVAEVVLPPKRAISAVPVAHATITDDERFAAVFNLTPATSLSIVDLEKRALVGEIEIPGCSLVYTIDDRRLASLCNDGSLLVVTLDDDGREKDARRSRIFFSPDDDPIMENAVRLDGRRWLFFSVEGKVHPIDFSGAEPRFEETWTLSDDVARERWRIGGRQRVAVHSGTGRLFVLMHEGGPDSYKDPGSEVWVYDLGKRERIQRIELESTGPTIQSFPVELGEEWSTPMRTISGWMLGLIPAFVEEIKVTSDEQPLLVTSTSYFGGIGLYDARSGEFLKRVYSGNMTNVALSLAFAQQARLQ